MRTELTEDEKLINEFVMSILLSKRRFFIPDETETKYVSVIKLEDVSAEWREFREKWEAKNGIVRKTKKPNNQEQE